MTELIAGTRRDFLKNTGRVAAATALAGAAIPLVHAGEDNTIRVALIGCGGRGTGAAADALNVKRGPMKLVAMADVFPDRLEGSYKSLSGGFKNRKDAAGNPMVDVPKDRQFIGFDAYKKAMDCLKPGDIAIMATPLAFRWVHFTYAIEKGLNVFMEKPLTTDGPTSRRMLKLGEEADKKNLKVAIGLMSRHARHLQELGDRIHNGEIGDLVLMRAYRMQGPIGSMRSLPKPKNISEVEFQIRRFHSFLWASGGCYSDFYIHVIDHCCWMKNAWPVKAQALGGRHYRDASEGHPYIDQNFDTYSVEYTFADNTTLQLYGSCINNCEPFYHSYAHGTKGSAVMSKAGDCGAPSSIYKGQAPKHSDLLWQSKTKPGEGNPYQNEWNDFIGAIRDGKPYSELKRGVEASLVTSMGRMAAHTARVITFDEMLNCEHEMAPGADKLTMDGPAPLMADKNGRYPIPQPGIVTKREY
jgi:predicted dehydrogenase